MPSRTLQKRTGAGDLRNDIVRLIQSGQLQPGAPLSSAVDLAKSYGIAYVTAHKTIQQLANDGYCVRVAGKGTFVSDNPMPRRVQSVAIPAYLPWVPFHAHMVEELTFQAASRGIKAVVGRAEDTPKFIERMVQNDVRAMIRFPGCNYPHERLDERMIWRLLQEQGIATVVINNFWFEDGPFPSVCTNEESGVAEMMDHLIALGHRDILLIDELVRQPHFRSREAYHDALLRHNLPYDSRNVVFVAPPLDWREAKGLLARQMLKQSTAALAVCGDIYAVDLVAELKSLGVVLGKDYSLASFDGTPEGEAVGLSAIAQPITGLVETAFAMLEDEHQRDPQRVELKSKCVFRSSTGPVSK